MTSMGKMSRRLFMGAAPAAVGAASMFGANDMLTPRHVGVPGIPVGYTGDMPMTNADFVARRRRELEDVIAGKQSAETEFHQRLGYTWEDDIASLRSVSAGARRRMAQEASNRHERKRETGMAQLLLDRLMRGELV